MPAITATISILILFIVGAAIVYAIFLAVWMPAIYILKVRRKQLATLVAVLLVGLLYAACILMLFFRTTSPAVDYENCFGVPPGIDVVDLQSESNGFADSWHLYMQFNCSRATLDSLVASQGMTIDPEPRPLWDGPPQWWAPGPATNWSECYKTKNSMQGFAWEESLLIYNPNTKQANYYWQGID